MAALLQSISASKLSFKISCWINLLALFCSCSLKSWITLDGQAILEILATSIRQKKNGKSQNRLMSKVIKWNKKLIFTQNIESLIFRKNPQLAQKHNYANNLVKFLTFYCTFKNLVESFSCNYSKITIFHDIKATTW